MGISDTDDEMMDRFDNSLSDDDLEQSVEENCTPRPVEDTATTSIRSLPENYFNTSQRGGSYATNNCEHHCVYKTY